MVAESSFVETAKTFIAEGLKGLNDPSLTVEKGAVLLYQVTVDNNLRVMGEDQIRHPKRGDSAFQTDLCVFEERSKDVLLPRVVLEFKTSITTHDILTYSAKATKHKQIYPYLRYGLVASNEDRVPGRFFTHNEGLDFCLSLRRLSEESIRATLMKLVNAELDCSRQLENIAFGKGSARLFRTQVIIENAL